MISHLRVKSQSFKIASIKIAFPHYLPDLIFLLPPPHSVPSILIFFLFPKHSRHIYALAPWQQLLSLLRMFFPWVYARLTPLLIPIFAHMSCLIKAFLGTLSKTAVLLIISIYFLCLFIYLLYLLSIYHLNAMLLIISMYILCLFILFIYLEFITYHLLPLYIYCSIFTANQNVSFIREGILSASYYYC